MSSPNSLKTCLHIPQGGQKLLLDETIAIASKFFSPFDTALARALRSAHKLAPKLEFSMLVPTKYFPLVVFKQAPTLKSEYGEYEFFIALCASSIIFS